MGPCRSVECLLPCSVAGTLTRSRPQGGLVGSGKRLSDLGYVLAQCVLAVVLLIAVAFKAMVLQVPGNVPSSPVLRMLVISELLVEWFIAAWLMSGIAQAWSRRAAMSLLLLFVAVTTWRLASGDPDCHCFGAFRVPPLITLSFDLAALFALYCLGRAAVVPRPEMPKDQNSSSRPLLPLRVSFAVMVSIVLPTSMFVAERRLLGPRVALASILPMDPQTWPGGQFPLLQELGSQDRADLVKGDRTVIVFSHDCEECRRYLAQRADALTSDPGAIGRIRLIDVAPATDPVDLSAPFPQLHLNRSVILLGAVPLEVTLKDGIVETIRHPE